MRIIKTHPTPTLYLESDVICDAPITKYSEFNKDKRENYLLSHTVNKQITFRFTMSATACESRSKGGRERVSSQRIFRSNMLDFPTTEKVNDDGEKFTGWWISLDDKATWKLRNEVETWDAALLAPSVTPSTDEVMINNFMRRNRWERRQLSKKGFNLIEHPLWKLFSKFFSPAADGIPTKAKLQSEMEPEKNFVSADQLICHVTPDSTA